MRQPDMLLMLDMDGVVVDFVRGMHAQFGVEYPYSKTGEELYSVMDANYKHVFRDLPKLPGADLLLDLYQNNPGRVKFLSAVPAHWSVDMYFEGRESKATWLINNLKTFNSLEDLIVVGDKRVKQFYATDTNILVDDHDTTIKDWKARRGIGIHYDSNGKSEAEQLRLAEEIVYILKNTYNFK
jgi:hypothetical protein